MVEHSPSILESEEEATMTLSRYSVETYPEMSSHATCQGKFGHSRVSSLSHCGLILALKE